jgi:peptide/nickel transport system permease protein
MRRLLLTRLLWAGPVLLAILLTNFLLTRLVPGDPLTAIIGEYPVTPEYRAQIIHSLQLDSPLAAQLYSYLRAVLHGELGFSFVNQQPVSVLILERMGASLMLLVPALLMATGLGLLLARLSMRQRRGAFRMLLTAITLFGYSVPVFWLGQMLIIAFAVNLHWLPAQGMQSLRPVHGTFGPFLDFFLHWLMPGFTVAVFHVAVIARVAQASLRDAAKQDFVTTARAKGLSERSTFWRHVLPNAMLPVITVMGYHFGAALTGTIMVESVFAWPGLGSLLLNSITNRDYPVVQGVFLLSASVVVLANVLTDLIYGLVDPRIRSGYAAGR